MKILRTTLILIAILLAFAGGIFIGFDLGNISCVIIEEQEKPLDANIEIEMSGFETLPEVLIIDTFINF